MKKKHVLALLSVFVFTLTVYTTYLYNPHILGNIQNEGWGLRASAPNANNAASVDHGTPSTTPRSVNDIFEKKVNSKAEAIERLKEVEAMVDRPAPGLDVAQEQFLKNQIIVKFSDQDDISVIQTNGRKAKDVVAEYEAMDNVDYAEPDYLYTATYIPNDTYFKYQWNFSNSQGLQDFLSKYYNISDSSVNAPAAWDINRGANTVVAVIDTGVAYETYLPFGFFLTGKPAYKPAPDMVGTSFVQGYDFVHGDSRANDDEGHGTHVAGTIAQATNNKRGAAGLAHKTTIMPIKVLDANGAGASSNIAKGIKFAADKGVDVINLSLGGPSYSVAMRDAVCYAYFKGVTVVAASGNNNGAVSYPAAYDGCVISVGASDSAGHKASFSNYGSALDLMAPGFGIYQQTFESPGSYTKFAHQRWSGTSMAAPHVAAAAAMIKSHGNAKTPDDIEYVLQKTAKDLGSKGWDKYTGYGLIDIAAALKAKPPADGTPPANNEFHYTSFEGNWKGWTQDNQNDWRRTTQSSTKGKYAAEVDGYTKWGRLTSPNLKVSSLPNTKVTFDWKIEKGFDSSDKLYFQVSPDGGKTWSIQKYLKGPGDNKWRSESFTFNGLTNISIRFNAVVSHADEDAFVDNVRITGF